MKSLTNKDPEPVRGLFTCSSVARAVLPVLRASLGDTIKVAVLLVQSPALLTGFGMTIKQHIATDMSSNTIYGLEQEDAKNLFRLVADPGVLAFLNNVIRHDGYPDPAIDVGTIQTYRNNPSDEPAAYMEFYGTGETSSTVFYKSGQQLVGNPNLYRIASLKP